MRHRILAAALSLLTLSACVTGTTLRPIVSLTQVERPATATERYGAYTLAKATTDSGVTRYAFEDRMVQATFHVGESAIFFDLLNKTEHSIRILWSEVTFVSPEGDPSPVMHTGIKYSECEADKPAAVIPKGVKVSDMAIPCTRVRMGVSTWVKDPLIAGFQSLVYSGYPASDSLIDHLERETPGKSMSLLMPLQIEGVTNEYTFTFKVDSVSVKRPAARKSAAPNN